MSQLKDLMASVEPRAERQLWIYPGRFLPTVAREVWIAKLGEFTVAPEGAVWFEREENALAFAKSVKERILQEDSDVNETEPLQL